jgi:DNA repair protein RecN (Recombination protein N)
MLTQLDIRNFAIIDDLSLELEAGMTVLTGETGAGKSILLDALGLLLGDRADASALRAGAERAEISASFELDDASEALEWLRAREFDIGDAPHACLVRRVVARDGRGRAFINGSPVTTRDLKEFGECLVDIHGQHEHQSLMRRDVQRDIVDGFGRHGDLTGDVARLFREHRAIEERIASLTHKGDDGGMRVDFLRFQVQELEALRLQPDELAQLDLEHKRLSNAGRLIEQGQQALQMLYEDEDAIYDRLSHAQHVLAELSALEPAYAAAAELAATAKIQLQEAADGVRRVLDGLDLDPKRLQQVESRLADITTLARKHRVPPAELAQHQQKLSEELALLESAAGEIDALTAKRAAAEKAWRASAKALHEARRKAGKSLARKITEQLRGLGMPQGEFAVAIAAEPEAAPREHGFDQIEFTVTLNPGQEHRPLARVASGGELSRISLAIQVCSLASTAVGTLVFDEVDAGIGGGVAEIVGRQLRTLGDSRQVLCVTHLAQVAAQARQQLQVWKEVRKGQTYTRVQALADKERIEEVARMLGGVEITAQTRAHAKEMISRAAAR